MKLRLPAMLAVAATAALLCSTAMAQSNDTLAKIKSSGVIQIGGRESQIPFSYKPNGGGDPVGFTTDICLKIVDAIKAKLAMPNLEVRYTMLTSTNRIPLLTNGTVDLDCATTTNTVDRQKQVAFAPSHFVTSITAAVKKSSGINSFADMNGKTVSAVSGSTSIALLRAQRKTLEVKEIYAKDTADGFLMMASDRAVAYVLDDVQLAGFIATAPNPGEFKILTGESLRQEPYGIMYRKDDPAFKDVVDGTVTELMKSGAIEQIYAKWFLKPIPPTNANLNFPMTDAIKDIYRNPNSNGV
ncbi:transporter substrate-binding domain-containing protein [Xylophilus rhododendri]|uniref:Transporter substrate-binding domain-containing protein n=1 Tax=Xylophilus rhododendri TaxID=2697032 RepID=A0A857J9M2_9BURK|nr:amino acid ABC transporter substrate-binding protein [Xylophilus rhododendri]QHJ00428.1 transporter substrate-binding domain-containing protein [Xylophilus rhododendri]